MLDLKLLGSFEIRDLDGGALPKKAQALLAYLALNRGRSVPRDQLAGLLWCVNTGEQARQNLRQCLTVMRTALGEAGRNAIEASAAGIRLAPSESVAVDVHRFETLARSSTISELALACALHGEGLLAGLEITSEPFNEWLALERARLAAMHLDALRRLAEAQAAAGDIDAAIASARELVLREPLREDGHRLLMGLYMAAGRRGEALRQFIACSEVLRRELDVAPDKETSGLAERIRAGLDAPPAPSAANRGDDLQDASPATVTFPASSARWKPGRRPLAVAASIAACGLLLTGIALAFLPPAPGPLVGAAVRPSSNRATPAVRAGSQSVGNVGKAALSDGDRRDCSSWHAKAGYSVDYIAQRTGKRQPGFALEWLSNIDRKDVEPGDVAIFDAWHGHAAYVEQVRRDAKGKPVRLLVSSWNKPGKWLDAACVVTEDFGRTNTFWVDADTASRFWRPNL